MMKKIVGFSISIKSFLIVMFLTQVAVFLSRYKHLLRSRCRADRKLVLIRIKVFTSECNGAREGLEIFEALCIRVSNN